MNYAIGLGVTRFEGKRWFPCPPGADGSRPRWFQRWGCGFRLFSWGAGGRCDDSGSAGVHRTPSCLFVWLVGVAKTSRDIVLMLITAQMTG